MEFRYAMILMNLKKSKSELWTETENDGNVLEYWKLPNGNYILKLKKAMV